MSDFSEASTDEFQGIRWHRVAALLEVLAETQLAAREQVGRRYRERASMFEANLAFAMAIGAVTEDHGVLSAHQSLSSAVPLDSAQQSNLLLGLLCQHDTRYRRIMRRYIAQFQVADGTAVYRPSPDARSAGSGVRNLLMDLKVLAYDHDADHYVLMRDYNHLYAQSCRPHSGFTPAQLESQLQARGALGLEAELEVLSYERERLGEQLSHLVDHVASRDVAAGYDIVSVTLRSDGRTEPRYIEVKGVPRTTYGFYWTANEVGVAELYGLWYYLYLVPVAQGNRPDIQSMRVVRDPCNTVLRADSEWVVETNIMRCSLI